MSLSGIATTLLLVFSLAYGQYVDRFRGVPLIKKPLYDPTGKTHFTCLDGSVSIPFEFVNDDYCDCKDGSDEPGTSACSNAKFHCPNLGHKAQNIPSSRVNDMVCDCCDGSDEYAGYTKCSNYCEEAGKAAREEAARRNAVQREGYQKRAEFVRQGREKKSDNVKKLKELLENKENMTKQVDELDMVKQVAEKSEKEAKDLHISKWKAEVEAQDQIKQKEKATEAFGHLDIDSNQRLTADELVQRMEFDKNQDGKINEEEITEYFGESKNIALDDFINDVWSRIKDVYKSPISEELPTLSTVAPDSAAALRRSKPIRDIKTDEGDLEKMDDEPESEDEVKEDEVEDFDTSSSPPPYDSTGEKKDDDQEKMPDFDENTKKLITDADQARKECDEAKKKLRDLEDEIRQLEEFERIDLGTDNEFAGLHKQCFEYTDMQYTYGLCLFDRTYQKPIGSSHNEVGLGTWDSWTGQENDRYSKQSYKHGLTCWNGPARSTEIKLTCGVENRLITATEPAKCEYFMEFETPVVCSAPESDTIDAHLEL